MSALEALFLWSISSSGRSMPTGRADQLIPPRALFTCRNIAGKSWGNLTTHNKMAVSHGSQTHTYLWGKWTGVIEHALEPLRWNSISCKA